MPNEFIDFTDHRFSAARLKINNMHSHGKTWDEILLGGKENEAALLAFLKEEYYGEVTLEDWHALVDLQKTNIERSELINVGPSVLPKGTLNSYLVPKQNNSLWVDYKKHLNEAGFLPEDVEAIEKSAIKTLNHLKFDADKHTPCKGVVVGNVQSGKTANMAALIAMASDMGWNTFIILTGVIDNLRKQTLDRMENDLHSNTSRVQIKTIPDLKRQSPSSLHLNPGDIDRYLFACIKNSRRLKELLTWLNKDKTKKQQMRVLIIDDEADQASLNTKDIDGNEKTAINRLIVDLVYDYNDYKKQMIDPDAFFACCNYVGYTATPYGNFLNEGPSIPGKLTLFPEDFIGVLSNSKTYFGPQQIFGAPGIERLKVINHIGANDTAQLAKIIDGTEFVLPRGLKDCFFWFYCCLACFRLWGYKKPVSMLVNISQSVDSHDNALACFQSFVKNLSLQSLITECRRVYERQTEGFTKADFLYLYPDYAGPDVKDYPLFDDLIPYIEEIYKSGFGLVKKDPTTKRRIYTKGIHCFIDNGRYINSDKSIADYRVEYPTDEDGLEYATGFLVIGGQTLSRGLTIVGLAATYFARGSKQGDTLMQMGRWFGYRKGYELLQRIWMTQENDDRFVYLSRIDLELKRYIDEFSKDETKLPKHYGIRVLNSPFPGWMSVTSSGKMQDAVTAKRDYSDNKFQTTKFFPDADRLSKNIQVTQSFIDKTLSSCTHRKINNRHIWNNVSWADVANYLLELSFPSTDCEYLDVPQFKQWMKNVYEKGHLDPWEVIFSGPDHADPNRVIPFGTIEVAMVNRARDGDDVREDRLISIGALRDNRDLFASIPEQERLKRGFTAADGNNQAKIAKLREDFGYGKTPQLIIYLVAKDSKPTREGNGQDLDASEHVLGIALNVPRGNVQIDYTEELIVNLKKYQDSQNAGGN